MEIVLNHVINETYHFFYFLFSAVKWLIASKISFCLHNMSTVYIHIIYNILYIYVNITFWLSVCMYLSIYILFFKNHVFFIVHDK